MTGRAIVVMGVAGCGKSTVARSLARRTGWVMVEGDDLHPAANVAKMGAGRPLDDADRLPWLRAIVGEVRTATAGGGSVVVTCSALKRRYRTVLRAAAAEVFFVHLHGDAGLIGRRLESRTGHFMPRSLLDSQLAALEELGADERGLVVDVGLTLDQQVDQAMAAVGWYGPQVVAGPVSDEGSTG